MPAILRIFLYQTDASLSLLGLCGSYGQSRGEEAGGGADVDLEQYAVRTLVIDPI